MTELLEFDILLHMLSPQQSPPIMKAPRSIASGPLCVCMRAGYSAGGTARAALAAFFFARLTFAQRFC